VGDGHRHAIVDGPDTLVDRALAAAPREVGRQRGARAEGDVIIAGVQGYRRRRDGLAGEDQAKARGQQQVAGPSGTGAAVLHPVLGHGSPPLWGDRAILLRLRLGSTPTKHIKRQQEINAFTFFFFMTSRQGVLDPAHLSPSTFHGNPWSRRSQHIETFGGADLVNAKQMRSIAHNHQPLQAIGTRNHGNAPR